LGVDRDEWAHVDPAPVVPPVPGRGLTTLLAIDRLDYTKGMSHRLAAFERLLERHPELCGRVRLLAVAAPSRDSVVAYQEHRTAVDQLIGRIQGRFATPDWVPVHYMVRAFSRVEVAALYRLTDVMLVTPLRDGMNLVAKEFVACRSDGDGVLVLSEFAGAVSELDGALVVNPYDVEATAAAYERAILMDPEERRSRMVRLRHQLAGTSPKEWSERFLHTLAGVRDPGNSGPGHSETPGQLALALDRATAAGRLVLLLDYDGTLVEIQASPERAIPDSELLGLLGRLVKRRRTEVHIVSGRSRGFLERWLGSVGVHLHAEHGAFTRRAREHEWENHVTIDPAWQPEVRALATWFARRTPGAAVEFKETGLTWHWRGADAEFGFRQAMELASRLEQAAVVLPITVAFGDKVIEVRPRGCTKGAAVLRVAAGAGKKALCLSVGDDQTDEEMFEALPAGSIALHVGAQPSRAALRVSTVSEVRSFLAALAGT
jgi:trehalose 6-phosphate synthase/phosphatase